MLSTRATFQRFFEHWFFDTQSKKVYAVDQRMVSVQTITLPYPTLPALEALWQKDPQKGAIPRCTE
jgi:hypothetical protein